MSEPMPDEKVEVSKAALDRLTAKAMELADLLQDAETNHGGLIGTKTMRSANELRLELSRWK